MDRALYLQTSLIVAMSTEHQLHLIVEIPTLVTIIQVVAQPTIPLPIITMEVMGIPMDTNNLTRVEDTILRSQLAPILARALLLRQVLNKQEVPLSYNLFLLYSFL